MRLRNLFLILLTFANCKETYKQEEFSLLKKNFDSSFLKIDGYFITSFKTDADFKDIYVFYKNGIALDLGTKDDNITFEEKFRNGQYYQQIKNNPNVWGLFNIDSTNIKIEHPRPMGWIETPVYTSFGEILNDTTFILTKRKHSYGLEEVALQDTFHFKQFSPKPDSTNRWIK